MTSHDCRGGPPGAGEAQRLVLLALGWLTWHAISLEWPVVHRTEVLTAYGLVAVLGVGIVFATRLLRAGVAPLPMTAFAVGAGFSLAGASFDMLATVLHCPDLSNEQNPYARALLDSGHRLPFVYVYCLICNLSHQGLVVLLWGAFLRHRGAITEQFYCFRKRIGPFPPLASLLDPRCWPKLAFLTWSQGMYALLWVLTTISVVSTLYRWYLGLEWFGVFSGHAMKVAVVTGIVSLAIHYVWIWFASQRLVAVKGADESAPAPVPVVAAVAELA